MHKRFAAGHRLKSKNPAAAEACLPGQANKMSGLVHGFKYSIIFCSSTEFIRFYFLDAPNKNPG